jgi:hypothetical protein
MKRTDLREDEVNRNSKKFYYFELMCIDLCEIVILWG